MVATLATPIAGAAAAPVTGFLTVGGGTAPPVT
jgi:hypothetical protein